MLKRWQKIALIVLATALTIAIVLFAVSFLFSTTAQICAPDEYTRAKECSQYHLGPFVVLWIIAVADGHNGLVTALATVFVAGFTLTLWRTSKNQGRLTQQSIDLARQEFISTHRPRIIVHSVTLPLDLMSVQTGMVIGAFVLYFNVGSTAAKNIEIRARITRTNFPIQSGIFVYDEVQAHSNDVIGGMKDYFQIRSEHLVSSERIIQESAQRPVAAVICMGTITYRDELGTRRETGFCQRFDAVTERWISAQSPEYEYAY